MSLPETFRALYQADIPGGQPRFEQIPIPKPGENEVLVKIEFAPLNPSDITIMHGYSKYFDRTPYPVGQEGSGTVVAIGSNLKVPHKIGDRVHVADAGTYSQYVLTQADNCSPILGDLSFEDAASHYINPATVYLMGIKVELGGHKAAINTAGSSALGRMLIRYFKYKGIKLINVVRRDEYIEELKKEGADYVLNLQAPDFEAQLTEIAAKEQATIAFDAINGEFTGKLFKCLPPNSACYIYGMLEGPEPKGLHVKELVQGKILGGLFIFSYIEELRKKGELAKTFDEVHSLLPTVLSSKLLKVFKIDELQEALAYYKDNSSKGKILFRPN